MKFTTCYRKTYDGEEKIFLIDGREVAEEEYNAEFERVKAGLPKIAERGYNVAGNFKKPIHSDALAVHPDDAAAAEEDSRRKGVPTEFDRNGSPVFHSSRQFRDYAKAYGFVHKGY